MPVTPTDKPLDTLRDDTVDQLIMNYGHGELSLDAFQRRLDQAFDARDHESLLALTSDLDLQVDSGYVSRKREELDFQYPARDLGADRVNEVDYVVDIFGGSKRSGMWVAPEEIRVFTVFGGSHLDFTEARFSGRTSRIRLVCVFGGVDIYVPEGVNTTVRTFSIFGGMNNKAPQGHQAAAPHLIIEGLILFGGGNVKTRKTFKDRLLDFADGVRAMFAQSSEPSRDDRRPTDRRIG